jgi:hypothetical protein
MDRRSRQRIWKLERLLSKTERLLPAVLTKLEKNREPLEAMFSRLREAVRLHTTAVAAIVISGEPKIDEPLVRAWERTLAHHRMDGDDSTLDDDAIDMPFPELRPAEKMYPAIVAGISEIYGNIQNCTSLVATVYSYSVRRSGIRIRSAGHICRTIMGRGRGQGREAMASASIGYHGCGRSSLHRSRGIPKRSLSRGAALLSENEGKTGRRVGPP